MSCFQGREPMSPLRVRRRYHLIYENRFLRPRSNLVFFNTDSFWATEALNTLMLAFDLMILMRQAVIESPAVTGNRARVQHTPNPLRHKLFAKPAYITTQGRKPMEASDSLRFLQSPGSFRPIYPP